MNSNWSYSPETPNLGQIPWFFSRVTLKFDWWPWKTIGHLFYAASNCVHNFIAICEFKLELRVRKRPSWVLTSVTLTFDLKPWPFARTSLLSMVMTPEHFMMIRWWEHGEKGVTDRRTDRRTDVLNQSYSCLVAAKNSFYLIPEYLQTHCLKLHICISMV